MALRDQPYLPLYIQDIMTDEKLNECCAATHGVYIKGIMCLMHKSETYGKILLRQKYKQIDKQNSNQNESMCLCFANMLANHLPYTVAVIFDALVELIREDVCQFEDDYLVQKRMVRDGELSIMRSLSGKKGGEISRKLSNNFAQAKSEANTEANTEYENEYENNNTLHNLPINKLNNGGENFSKNGNGSKIHLSGADRLAEKIYKRQNKTD